MYKLIALDLDGTVLKKDKTISEANLSAILRAKKSGIKIVLSTGRPLKGILPYLEKLQLLSEDDYAVTFNGCLVLNTITSKPIIKKTMKHEDVLELYNLSKKLNVNMHALCLDYSITQKESKYSRLESDLNSIPLCKVDFSNLNEDLEIYKVLLVEENEILTSAVNNIPKEYFDRFSVQRSAPYFLEFFDKTVNKGAGVAALAEKLSIKPEEVICMGDAENDISMIKYAGLGVAMENAFPHVKKIADFITRTNEEDGVAHVINKFVFGN